MSTMPYWKIPAEVQKDYMTVHEMREMLGLGKTESYWLMHKGNFKVYEADGMYRIDTASFERWYAKQMKYRKTDGPPPGAELKKRSYSIPEIGEMLGIDPGYAYQVLGRDHVKTFLVDGWKRVRKKDFEEWYESQSRYRIKKDRERDKELEDDSIWLPDAARMLGVDRSVIYSLMSNKETKDKFTIIEIGKRKRVTKESFYRWYEGQSKYRLLSEEELEEKAALNGEKAQEKKLKKLPARKSSSKNAFIYTLKEPKNPKFYTIDEVIEFYGFSRTTVTNWIKKGNVPSVMAGRAYRLPREEFDDWLDMIST